jgi:hypothetical protein
MQTWSQEPLKLSRTEVTETAGSGGKIIGLAGSYAVQFLVPPTLLECACRQRTACVDSALLLQIEVQSPCTHKGYASAPCLLVRAQPPGSERPCTSVLLAPLCQEVFSPAISELNGILEFTPPPFGL